MSTTLPETDNYTETVKINTDGEPFNANGYWETVQGVNNRVVNVNRRVATIEAGVPEFFTQISGFQRWVSSANDSRNKSFSLPGRPMYSNPNQYWGTVDPATGVMISGGNYPATNMQDSGDSGSLVATPGEWTFDYPNAGTESTWTEEQTRKPLRIYAPEKGWYMVESSFELQYYIYAPSPVGTIKRQTNMSVLHSTGINGTNSGNYGTYVDSFQDRDYDGPLSYPSWGTSGIEDAYRRVQFGGKRTIFLNGDSTDLADYYYPEIYIGPNVGDLYTAGGDSTAYLPSFIGTIRMTKVETPIGSV